VIVVALTPSRRLLNPSERLLVIVIIDLLFIDAMRAPLSAPDAREAHRDV
jgi:hypothetical protein